MLCSIKRNYKKYKPLKMLAKMCVYFQPPWRGNSQKSCPQLWLVLIHGRLTRRLNGIKCSVFTPSLSFSISHPCAAGTLKNLSQNQSAQAHSLIYQVLYKKPLEIVKSSVQGLKILPVLINPDLSAERTISTLLELLLIIKTFQQIEICPGKLHL